MIDPKKFTQILQKTDIEFFVWVPDSSLKYFCAYVSDNFDKKNNIIAANEWNAIWIAAGYYLATWNIPLVYMQNSWLGNCVNPLLSLVDEHVYNIPMLLMIWRRGEPWKKDEPQHITQWTVTLKLLETMWIRYAVIDWEEKGIEEKIKNAQKYMLDTNKPFALVMKKWIFEKYLIENKTKSKMLEMSREDALKLIIWNIGKDSIIVSTTWKLSRELFEYREELNEWHDSDFLTVWSMGHSSQIALGIALQKKNKKVYCFDGDGAIIMHTWWLWIVWDLKPKNYVHILFNNGAHESVWWQKTIWFDIDFVNIARSFGYVYCNSVESKEDLISELHDLEKVDGPSFLEIKVWINSRKDLWRPTNSPLENKKLFMDFLNK